MGTLRFLADEHVPRVFVNALRSSGFEIRVAHERYGQGTDDRSILSRGTDEGFVVLTNDRDFARLADENKHTGIVLYTDVDFLRISPREAVEAVVRIDRHYQRSELHDTVEWLDN
jgi:predicted nuclease of predicted toxin-antitoxin system